MADNLFWRDASGRLTFSMGRVPADNYPAMCDVVAEAFALAHYGDLVTDGYDIVFQEYRSGDDVIGLEWDNWMGFTVVSKSTKSERLVEAIAAWLLQSMWATKA